MNDLINDLMNDLMNDLWKLDRKKSWSQKQMLTSNPNVIFWF